MFTGTGSTLVLDIAMVTVVRGDMTTLPGESITTVSTGSMAPATMTGEVVVTMKRTEGLVATMLTGEDLCVCDVCDV